MARFSSSTVFALSLIVAAAATPLSTQPSPVPGSSYPFTFAPLHVSEYEAPHGLVNNSYIVMLKKDVPQAAFDNHFNFLATVHAEDPLLDDDSGLRHVYNGHVRGYAGKFSEGVLKRIRSMPEVDFVERDQIVRTQDVETQSTQKAAPWVSGCYPRVTGGLLMRSRARVSPASATAPA
jgi:cerevisin